MNNLRIAGYTFYNENGFVGYRNSKVNRFITDGAPIDKAYEACKDIGVLTYNNIVTVADYLIKQGYGKRYVGQATIYNKLGNTIKPVKTCNAFVTGKVGVFYDDNKYLVFKDHCTLTNTISYGSKSLIPRLRELDSFDKGALVSWMDMVKSSKI